MKEELKRRGMILILFFKFIVPFPFWSSEAARVHELIRTLPPPLHLGTIEWKLTHFFESCMDLDAIEIDADRPLTSIISEFGELFMEVIYHK